MQHTSLWNSRAAQQSEHCLGARVNITRVNRTRQIPFTLQLAASRRKDGIRSSLTLEVSLRDGVPG
jgi:hypothetical protein